MRVAALTLADLAGSEKQRKTGAEGHRAKEVRGGAESTWRSAAVLRWVRLTPAHSKEAPYLDKAS